MCLRRQRRTDHFDDALGQSVIAGFQAAGGFLLGRLTYENFARHWPNQPADDPLAGTFNELPKHVVSKTLAEPLPWQNSRLINDDVPAQVARLKEGEGKDILVIGSGELVQTLMQHDLVDEYVLMVHPITMGKGKRLFRDGSAMARLKLVDSKPTFTGVLILTYVPAPD